MNADPPDESPEREHPGSGQDAAPDRRLPAAEEIEVPDSWQLDEDEAGPDVGDEDEVDQRDRRRPREALSGRLARRAGGVMAVFDRLLLVIAIGGPLLILGYQSFEWLRSSQWPPMPVRQVLLWLQADTSPVISAAWPGVNRALNWLLAVPLSLFLFVAGLLLHFLCGLIFPRVPRE